MALERKGEEVLEAPSQQTSDKLRDIFTSTDYIFDLPTFALIIIGVIILLFMNITYGQSTIPEEVAFAESIDRILPFLSFGLVIYLFFILIKRRERPGVEPTEFRVIEFTGTDITATIVAISVGLVFLVIIHNTISQITIQSVENANYIYFYIIIAIAEEVAFSVLTQLAVELVFKSWIAGVFARSLTFAIFHLQVYGESPELLVLTFLSGLIFALMLKVSKRLSANIIVHALINAIAFLSMGG